MICNMLADLAGEQVERVKFPLPDFTEAQCSALLAYLYATLRKPLSLHIHAGKPWTERSAPTQVCLRRVLQRHGF